MQYEEIKPPSSLDMNLLTLAMIVFADDVSNSTNATSVSTPGGQNKTQNTTVGDTTGKTVSYNSTSLMERCTIFNGLTALLVFQ